MLPDRGGRLGRLLITCYRLSHRICQGDALVILITSEQSQRVHNQSLMALGPLIGRARVTHCCACPVRSERETPNGWREQRDRIS